MPLLSITFEAHADQAEAMTEAIMEAGGLSAVIEDADAGTEREIPQFDEPGITPGPGWAHSRVTALVEEATDIPFFLDQVQQLSGQKVVVLATETIDDQNWVALTQSQFDPIRVSERLWIVPSWHTPPQEAAIAIRLDPGMAFGTGSHPTTFLCLQWLEHHVQPGMTVLDYGCGSGILAICAALLKASGVTGTDIDPAALEAAAYNARENKVSLTLESAGEKIQGQFDVVVANILSNPLRVLAPTLCSKVRLGGRLVLSGILESQAEELIAIYRPWIELHVSSERDGWICLAGQKN